MVIQGYTREYMGEFTRVCGGIQGYTNVNKGIHGYT